MPSLQQLSGPHCVLLAVHYASESNVLALRALTTLRDTDLPLELVLSILLTYLPEELEPSTYIEYLSELATGSRDPGDDPHNAVDVAAVEDLSLSRAKKRRKALELLPVTHSLYAAEDGLDALSHFLIHRAHRIDAQTGLLDLIPQLVGPFLGHSEFLRTWYISTVLPLLRLSYEYYPQSATGSLDEFARLKGKRAIDFQLSNVRNAADGDANNAARDLKGVVAPWLCGAHDRKRRRLSSEPRRASIAQEQIQDPGDWDCLFQWMLHTSKDRLPLVTAAFSAWDGPEDMDLGGFEEGRDYIGDEEQRRLEIHYAQTGLACLFLIERSDTPTLQTAHSLLGRICDLLNCEPPPDLQVGIDSLPAYDLQEPVSRDQNTSILQEHRLLELGNPLTKPSRDVVQMTKLILFSACALSSMQHPVSTREVAIMNLRNDRTEQLSLLQKIIHKLVSLRQSPDQWRSSRAKLVWLWDWGAENHDSDRHGQGILGLLERGVIEIEILKALIEGSHYALVIQTYIKSSKRQQPLSLAEIEDTILKSAIHHYDNASNGNRTRGGMKRAAEITAPFAPHFPQSSRFPRMQALLSATHAMSFYSLTLQHGVPFQPVHIRASASPLSLLQKLLGQNLGSYTKLDDLISIGQNLIISMPATLMDDNTSTTLDASTISRKKAAAERRVVGMAIDAALEEGDFETAYSYVVNRLSPSSPSPTPSLSSTRFSFSSIATDEQDDDAEDIAWRAALRAGRFQSSPLSPSWTHSTARPDLRRLEQRMDLLSQALLLAPPPHLEEVLTVWQQCEAEMTTLLAAETEAEERFNDAADRKLPGTFLTETIAVQPRREVGRGAVEEAPMGLFDVARGAAAAFSKSAFPLRGAAQGGRGESSMSESRGSVEFSDDGLGHDERVRKRDMVASAATGALASGTGALASGLGWMLGAKPVQEQGRERE